MVNILGSDNSDIIQGTLGDDLASAGLGNDRILGLAGNDLIFGNASSDFIAGNVGGDVLFGGRGDDDLRGGSGNDLLYGDWGNDTVNGDRGDDTILGGSLFSANVPERDVDWLLGGDGNDWINGNTGIDTVAGGAGDDRLNGGKENDVLFGDAGDDRLSGDLGADTLTGGDGNDTFDLDGTGAVTLADADIVTDFTPTKDRLQLKENQTFDRLNLILQDGNTIVQDRQTGEFLAILQGVTHLDRSNFIDTTPAPSPEPPSPTPLPEPPSPTPLPEPSSPTPTPAPSPELPSPTPTPTPSPELPSPTPTPDRTPTPEPSPELPSPTPTPDRTPTPEPEPEPEPEPTPTTSTYNFTQATFSANEGSTTNTSTVVRVNRTGNTSLVEDVTLELTEGTATADTDFRAGAVTVRFAAGETSKAFPIEIFGNIDTLENDETIALSFDRFSGGGVAGTRKTATLTIVEDDDVVTDTQNAGLGSLRQALLAANHANSIANPTITFSGASGTITLTTALPEITRNLTLAGPGAENLTVSGNNSVRVFGVATGIAAKFQDLTISNGSAPEGGGIFNNGGNVTVENAILANHAATAFNGLTSIGGAGIASRDGNLTIVNTEITGSHGTGAQGISYAVNSGTHRLTITNSTISGGTKDGILIGLGAGNTTVNLSGNTIGNNGQNEPLVGDGIAIGLVFGAAANFSIQNNILENNFDEGIDIRFGAASAGPIGIPSSATVTGVISGNTIDSNGQNGLEIKSDNPFNTFTSTFTISDNTGNENILIDNSVGNGTLTLSDYTNEATLATTDNALTGGAVVT